MPYYEITPDKPDDIAQATARIKAVGAEVRDEIRAIIAEAVAEGRRVAERDAPVGPERMFRDGVRIRDAIGTSEVRYAPGGLGGGGFYEASVHADEELSPEVRYVMEGTKDNGIGKIYPARGNVGVLGIDNPEWLGGKQGIHYRKWVHGQHPQTGWWDSARDATRLQLESGLDSIR